jgi:hypothetical protein
MIRTNGGWDMFKMIEVEKYPCNDKREALQREDEVTNKKQSNMNSINGFITDGRGKSMIKNIIKIIKK